MNKYIVLVCEYKNRKEIVTREVDAHTTIEAVIQTREWYKQEMKFGRFKDMVDVLFDFEVVKL